MRARVRRLVLEPGELRQGILQLGPEQRRHLEVLRVKPGAPLELSDGEGLVGRAELRSLERRGAEVEVLSLESVPPPASPSIILLQGVGKGDKLDAVVRQACELGVRRIVPVTSMRAVAKGDNKGERLRGIANDALRVSGRAWRARIDSPMPFEAALSVPAERKLVLALDGARPLGAALEAEERPGSIIVLVGPEGGFEPDELELARKAGFEAAHLGPHTLRTETAGPAVVAMVRYHFFGH